MGFELVIGLIVGLKESATYMHARVAVAVGEGAVLG